MLDPREVRKDFPIFERRQLVYLDNAATSQKPRQVIDAIREFYERTNANVGRGVYALSEEATDAYEEARKRIAEFIGAREDEVVFVKNASEALNMVAHSLATSVLEKGDRIVLTEMEHHSNLLPWLAVAKLKGFDVKIARVDKKGSVDLERLESLVSEGARVVAIAHVSNVLGTINDLREVSRIAGEAGALLVVDGAQSVPHMPVRVGELGADFLAFSGHKMLGPTGIGVLWGRRELLEEIEPPFAGGGTVAGLRVSGREILVEWRRPPAKFEAGTPNIAGAIGLAAAVEYLEGIGMEEVREHERRLTRLALELLSGVDGISLYGPGQADERAGIVTFNLGDLHPHEVAAYLDQHGIAVRSGHHCATLLHRAIGALDGTVRASFYVYNTEEEVEYLAEALKCLSSSL